jgi:RsiW-degrading membrane proteinase PrsW (M82 family)
MSELEHRRVELAPATWIWSVLRQAWVQTLIVGIVLWNVLTWTAIASDNLNLVPSVILVGAFLGPVTFVVYVYERVRNVSWVSLLQCFVVGGLIGVAGASLLEYRALLDYGALPTVAIGLIEETCKLLVPVFIFAAGRFRREADGLLIGVASGMGFAAFESMGYGLMALLASGGRLDAVTETLFVRTVLSPAGHAAWTGLVCAALWRTRTHRGAWPWVPVAFAVAVALHAWWDASASGGSLVPVAVISFGLIVWRIHAATSQRDPAIRSGSVPRRRLA